MKNTPAAKGFRMPAEWEDHEATWIGWPHNKTDWPGKIAPIHWVYGEITRKLAQGEIARILINDQTHEMRARRVLDKVGADFSAVEFWRFPTNRGWTRDFGPMFVKRTAKPSEIAIANFKFNAWAKYRDFEKDSQVPELAAAALKLKLFKAEYRNAHVVLEGGAIDVNGHGTLMTTEECLLDKQTQARNPDLGKAEIEEALRRFLGVSNIIWLGKGIEGDDTHGHVDDICRFVSADTVILCREKNSSDYNHTVLEENFERLQSARLEDGSKPKVIELPMPAPLYFDGRRLPASYANFYIANAAVLVPTFNDENDRKALGILAELFKGRPVIGIHAVDLVWGLGTLHCLTQQQPVVRQK
jgi:agmatine deiminase